jgi:hypothetical protein
MASTAREGREGATHGRTEPAIQQTTIRQQTEKPESIGSKEENSKYKKGNPENYPTRGVNRSLAGKSMCT